MQDLQESINSENEEFLPETLMSSYQTVRDSTERLCEPLSTEDFVVQSMPDASPTKWHLAHTTWFFEAFLLMEHLPSYKPFHPNYSFLFIFYYNVLGDRHCRYILVVL